MDAEILIVDDNSRVFESLKPNFDHFGIGVFYAPDGRVAEQHLLTRRADAVLLDIMLGGESGIDLLRRIKELCPKVPVIMITGFASIDTAIKSMKIGAFDYVKKPLNFDRLLKVIENAVEMSQLTHENDYLKKRIQELSPQVYVENGAMLSVIRKAAKLARTDIPVLIVGENGSGKEVIADYIHANSDRVASKMVKTNCAAFPDSLLDNELFGHDRGAFTGADSEFQGVFERANGSTMFLDEIGDMPLTTQAKILRVLQNGEIRRIGGTTTQNVDVRFVAATNKDLGDLMVKGLFRHDLYYRLNAAVVTIPPLRERREDVALLVDRFLGEISESTERRVEALDADVWDLFNQYSWPGNVRELKNTINYAVAISSGPVIRLEDVPQLLQHFSRSESDGLDIRQASEKRLIESTLRECRFNKTKSAEILNMSRKTLYAKIAKYGITA